MKKHLRISIRDADSPSSDANLATSIDIFVDTDKRIEQVDSEIFGHVVTEMSRYFIVEALHGIGMTCRDVECGHCRNWEFFEEPL